MLAASDQKSYFCRTLQREDAGQVRTLFKEVFAQDMSPEFWDWKYAHELGRATVVFQGDRLVAHYGGMGRKVSWKGKEIQAVQITDVMVAGDNRHAVRSGSPFYLAFTEFARHYLGYGKDFPLAYGFPNHRVMRLAELLKFYAPVGAMCEISWPAQYSVSAVLSEKLELGPGNFDQLRKRIDALWESMKQSLSNSIVGVKDASWLRKRYLEHPVLSYQLLLCQGRFGLGPAGVLVFRHDADRSFLMDVVADVRQVPALLKIAGHVVRQRGNSGFYTWCSTGFSKLFENAHSSTAALPITIPANIWTPGPDPAELKDQWWLLPGDTDFQ